MELADVLAVGYLVFLEGVLSVDNALALAALVRGRLRDEADRKRALRYGIIGAYLFRTVTIFCGVWLMSHEIVRWLAAAYLIYLGAHELFFKSESCEIEATEGATLSPLWQTVIAVELMDIMFSVDSIAVALSVSQKVWVLIAGAVLGILAMRFAAAGFIKLIERFPSLEKAAFVLVMLAGIKIVLELLGREVPELAFMGCVSLIVGIAMLLDLDAPEATREV